MGAVGIAIISKNQNSKEFDLNIDDINFETKGIECKKCPNNCDIICVYKNNNLIDSWGNRCENGKINVK
jgi:hypothetical protein